MNQLELFKADEPIRVLTWWEPYASLMLHGKIETRTWATNYRGLVLIHAAKKKLTEKDIIGVSGEKQTQRILNLMNEKKIREQNGFAIAVGRLVDCIKMSDSIAAENFSFVGYKPNLYLHIYKDVRPIKPFEMKGSQGWRTLTDEQQQMIEFL